LSLRAFFSAGLNFTSLSLRGIFLQDDLQPWSPGSAVVVSPTLPTAPSTSLPTTTTQAALAFASPQQCAGMIPGRGRPLRRCQAGIPCDCVRAEEKWGSCRQRDTQWKEREPVWHARGGTQSGASSEQLCSQSCWFAF